MNQATFISLVSVTYKNFDSCQYNIRCFSINTKLLHQRKQTSFGGVQKRKGVLPSKHKKENVCNENLPFVFKSQDYLYA